MYLTPDNFDDFIAGYCVEVPFDTNSTLAGALAASKLLVNTLPDYICGNLKGEKQNEEDVTFAPSIKRATSPLRSFSI